MAFDNVIYTRHITTFSDVFSRGPFEVFKENLRCCLSVEPLINVVDWERRY